MNEEQLQGGISNAGNVVRLGRHVLRPCTPHTESIHRLLRKVRSVGFDGVPEPVGIDDDGRERLEFIEGDVPISPYPAWSQTDPALASIARLLRRFHDASQGFKTESLTWNDALADPAGGRVMCHNDVELSNVVFRDGVAVALIDSEFAAPGRAIYDLAQFARLCVPIEDDYDKARMGWQPADGPARLRLIADAYGLDNRGRTELITAIEDAMARIEAVARRSLEEGGPTASAALASTGGIEKYVRRRTWWQTHRAAFETSLR